MKDKLLIITRDGKSANDFIEHHNLTKDQIVIVKTKDTLFKVVKDGGRYVIVPPLPFSYQWSFRPYLTNLTNMTRYYNNRLNKF